MVSSSSAPDWWDRRYSAEIVVLGKTSGIHEGDTTGRHYGDVMDTSGIVIVDSTGKAFRGDTTGRQYGDLYSTTGGVIIDSTGNQLTNVAQVEDQTVLNPITVANRRARQTGYTSALIYESHTSLDASARLYIKSHNLTIGGSTIAYSSAWLRPYLFNTTYYIYTDDSGWAGGGVVYVPTTVWDNVLQGNYRYYVGEIKTPDSGTYFTSGEAGGAGGQEE